MTPARQSIRASLRRCLLGAVGAVAAVAAATGCAYYNGVYNAKRWSRQAERAERAGRLAEARDRWQRAATHAESVTTRHARSRWADDAMLIRGRALVHMEFYSEAVSVLEQAARMAGEPEQRREALILLGHANLALRRLAEAQRALDEAVGSASPSRRSEAHLHRGRVLLAQGRFEAALADFLASTHPAALVGRARAALALRDTALAGAFFDSLAVRRPYSEREWLPLLDSLAAAGAGERASALVDRLLARADVGRGEKARLVLGDGNRRLGAADSAAAARFTEVLRTVPDSAEARAAEVRLLRLALAGAQQDSDLVQPRRRLAELVLEGGAASREAQPLLRLLEQLDSLAGALVTPDAFWFLRAELIRDSLGAPVLAAAAFARMAPRFPESPWTPKGLVAGIAAGHPAPDSLRALLRLRYATSPYALAALGEDALGYAALEDSLRVVLARRPQTRRTGGAPPAEASPEDSDEVIRRQARPSAPGQPAQPPPPHPRPAPRPPRGSQPVP